MQYHPVVIQIQKLLVQNGIWFETFEHEEVRTSEEAAKLRYGYMISQGAKALIIRVKKSGGEKFFAMVVIPGNQRFDNTKVKRYFEAKDIRFATEDEVFQITKGVLPGGVLPFGDLFSLKVVVDPRLLKNEKIVFNAGDRRFSIGMKAVDYKEIAKPDVVEII